MRGGERERSQAVNDELGQRRVESAHLGSCSTRRSSSLVPSASSAVSSGCRAGRGERVHLEGWGEQERGRRTVLILFRSQRSDKRGRGESDSAKAGRRRKRGELPMRSSDAGSRPTPTSTLFRPCATTGSSNGREGGEGEKRSSFFPGN